MTATPLVKVGDIYFKREDLNPTGSAKHRPLAILVKQALKQGYSAAAISSTGNAAISALYFCQKHHLNLTIFLSPKVDSQKLQHLRSQNPQIIFTAKPISQAFKFCRQNKAFNLRISQNPRAIVAYKKISLEIIKQLPQITSIFIPVGSGATLLGISQALPPSVKIFAVQPASACPIASLFDSQYTPETTTSTTSLGVKHLPLKNQVINTIKKSHGSGLVIADHQVQSQQKYLKLNQIFTSAEGALALAGFQKAQETNLNPGSHPVILLTGTQR